MTNFIKSFSALYVITELLCQNSVSKVTSLPLIGGALFTIISSVDLSGEIHS